MRRVVVSMRRLLVIVCLSACSAPAWSVDPLTLIILRLLRDRIISSGVESAIEQSNNRAATPGAEPAMPQSSPMPYGMNAGQLRTLIDEGFVHLSPAQRDEIYVAVQRILADPKNAMQAPAIISDLAIKASAVRQAHERMNRLSDTEKRRIAAEARDEYERLSAEDREQMSAVLRAHVVPLPADLSEMILDEFTRVAPIAATPLAAATSAETVALPAAPSVASPPGNPQ